MEDNELEKIGRALPPGWLLQIHVGHDVLVMLLPPGSKRDMITGFEGTIIEQLQEAATEAHKMHPNPWPMDYAHCGSCPHQSIYREHESGTCKLFGESIDIFPVTGGRGAIRSAQCMRHHEDPY